MFGITVALAVSLLAANGFAQSSTTGSIIGHVVDEKNAALPGARVEIASAALQGPRVVTSGDGGEFRFSLLPPGAYTLMAGMPSFMEAKSEDIVVGLGRTVRLEMTLTQLLAGDGSGFRGGACVDVDSIASGANVTSGALTTLPIPRDFHSIAQIAPGTSEDDAGTTVYGSTGAENQYIIDGLNTTGVETGLEGKRLNFDFIQEVEVKTGGLPAEYGRITGGIINAITKSGGNELHGDVFVYYAGGGLVEDNDTASDRPRTTTTIIDKDSESDYGFDLGGFFVKDRLWFFGAYNRVDETEKRTLIRALTAPGVGTEIDTDIERNLYVAKLTWRINDNNTFAASLFGDPTTEDGVQFAIIGPESTFIGTEDTGGNDYIGRYEGIFGGSVIVGASIGQHYEESILGGPGKSIARFIDATVVPNANTGGFGFTTDEEYTRDIFKLDTSVFSGSVEIKFGGDYEKLDATVDRYSGGAGQIVTKFRTGSTIYYRHRYFVDGSAPGFNREDPTTWRVAAPLTATPESDNISAYAQANWKAMPNLTINLGLRWESQELAGRPSEGSNVKLDDLYSPRIGFIWDVASNGRSKLYANYGRFYESIPMDINVRSFGGEQTAFAYNFDPSPSNITPDSAAPRRSSILGGSVTPVDPDLEGQYIDEILLGFEYEVAPNLAVGVKGTYRDLGQVIEDSLVIEEGNYFITNPGSGLGKNLTFYDYSTVRSPTPERTFKGIELTARKRFSDNWQFYASYLWSELEGSYDGVFQVSTGQLNPNINSAYNYADFSINNEGKLSNDRTHQVKLDGGYIFKGGVVDGLNVGLSAYYQSGTPLNAYGYSFAYGNWEYYLAPRGSLGRGPSSYEADLHIGYPLSVGPVKLNFLVDVFNLFDRQAATRLDERYNLPNNGPCGGVPQDICNGDGGLLHGDASLVPVGQLDDPRATATNPDYLKAGVAFTDPRSIRVGMKVSF